MAIETPAQPQHGPVELHVVTLGQLREPDPYRAWSDPDGLAPMTKSKRAAFLTNPLQHGDQEPVQIIATIDGRVIGGIHMVAGELVAKGVVIPTLWGSSLFVAADARRTGAGQRIVQRMHELADTVAICGISEMSSKLYDRLHWVRYKMPRMVGIIRSTPIVRRFLGRGGVATAAQAVGDVGIGAYRGVASLLPLRRTAGYRVRELQEMPASFDAAMAPGPSRVAPHRSSRWINWLLANEFNVARRTRLALVEDRGGRPLAYFLVKAAHLEQGQRYGFDDFMMGSLGDWVIFEPDAIDYTELVLLAQREVAKLGGDMFAAFLSEPASIPTLRMMGFLPFPGLDFIYFPNPGTRLADPELQRVETWRIRPADGDNFFS